MTSDLSGILLYVLVLVAVWIPYAWLRRRGHSQSLERLEEARSTGLVEPPSLHPVIDEDRCLGSGACVEACPEGKILGLIGGKAQLVEPTSCIGHGACMAACPFDAITLVLGTETRGIDIPMVDPHFQTNVPGLFVAGELGGMGLIRNAIEQGRQAIDSVRRLPGLGRGDVHDVLIVGAGPAGFSASLAAMEHGLRAITVEQETLGGTVAHYPRGKIVMTQPAHLPLYGQMRTRETTKEALLELWEQVERQTGVEIRYHERVEGISRDDGVFRVTTTRGTHAARAVLLAIGRRGTPRKLGVPGEEESPKVVYRLIEPEQYRGQRVLVVGGGDSALEAATSVAAEPDTEVALSYRSRAFGRAKKKNRAKLEEASEAGRVRVLLESKVREIRDTSVGLETARGEEILGNDAVIVCAGGILPTGFLREVGVEIETKFGTA